MVSTVNPEIFKKFKNARKVLIREDSEFQTPVEVREDEEQSNKLQEIIEILVAAGYFRARIKGLSAFDKVVGGMVWCIESTNVDLDVDLLFKENLSIGQKIALTEKIVAVLPKIKCPRSIEPHQIQGLDFIHIFPVIQWLVKRSLECRHEIAAFVRTCALEQFNRKFNVQENYNQKNRIWLKNMYLLSEIYRPHRYYKRRNPSSIDSTSQLQITLLEYGHNDGSFGDDSMFSNKDNEEINDIDVDIQSSEQMIMASLEEKREIFYAKCNELKPKQIALSDEIKSSVVYLQDLHRKQEEANTILEELAQNVLQNSKVKEIEDLITLNYNLKTQQNQFKEQCKKELANLNNSIQNAKKAKVNIPVETFSHLTSEFSSILEKNRLLKIKLAKINREVAILQRQVDDIPKRAELTQYQKRFIELYNQVAVKHKETKQYYTLYNTLEDTRVYMEKELSLLNSISDSYPEAMGSTKSKEEFLDQFQNIVENITQSKVKANQQMNKEKQTRDQLGTVLQTLVEQQRKYVTAIKQLGLECQKHETYARLVD